MPTERRVDRLLPEQLDARPDVRVAGRAAEQWGVLSVDELRGCGLSDDAIFDRVRKGWLHPIHRGVYAVGHANITLHGRFLAAVKACGPEAALSHFSAAALFGFLDWDDRHPEVTVPGAGTRVHRGIRVHRTRTLEAEDLTRHAGIPVTTATRTLVDLAAMLPYKALRRAVRQAQSLRLVSLHKLVEIVERVGPRRGTRRLRKAIATGPAPTRSELEDVVLDLMLAGGLVHPDVNVPLILAGRRVVPDFRWPHQRLVVEADGRAWHDNKLAREHDAERQALLEAHGERVVRVTWRQAVARRTETLARLRAAGAPSVELIGSCPNNSTLGGRGVRRTTAA
jgi:predicted transcriptional regulator of viral defense system